MLRYFAQRPYIYESGHSFSILNNTSLTESLTELRALTIPDPVTILQWVKTGISFASSAKILDTECDCSSTLSKAAAANR
jgi:hypothetical protein